MKVQVGAEGDTLVSDGRLEQVFYGLQRLTPFPDDLTFRTVKQEAVESGTEKQPALAVFYVTSPHPRVNKRALDVKPTIISIASMPYDQWMNANREWRHYAHLSDPLRPIFAGLLRQHLEKRRNLENLN